MVTKEKYSRFRWKEGREKDLWSFVDGRVKNGSSVTAALKEFGKKHDMSWLTARWKYYQLRKRAEPAVARADAPLADVAPADVSRTDVGSAVDPSGAPASGAVASRDAVSRDALCENVVYSSTEGRLIPGEQDFLGCLAEFIASSRDTGQDVVPFVRGLSRMAALSRESTILRREREARLSVLREDAEVLSSMCRFLGEWLELSQVDRVGSLKSFSSRLESEVRRLVAVRDRLAGA